MEPLDAGASFFFVAVMICLAGFLYFLPTYAASRRQHPQGTAIFLTNLLFGWTMLGWSIALIWAFADDGRSYDRQ